MPISALFLRIFCLKLSIISIALLLNACASSSSAPALDHSRTMINRPAAHVVVPGDTLFSIAWRYGLKYDVLAAHNRIFAPYIIRPSQVIRLDVDASAVNPPSGAVRPISSSFVQSKRSSVLNNNQIKQTAAAKASRLGDASLGSPQWRWPAPGPLLSKFQSNSGLNKGIDIGGKLREPVFAAASGRVVYSGSGLRGYGKLLIIKHNETYLSAYAHNETLKVKEGESVKAGQIIAEMGSTGTDRVKLHFEIRRDGTPVDPMKFLPHR